MSKNEQTVKAISDMLARLRGEMADYIKSTEEKIAGLEIAYEALTGGKAPSMETPKTQRASAKVGRGRRGMRIDRKSGEKTYAFLKERGDKPTTPAMVARKFNITAEAASQRLLNLHKAGQIARVEKGRYIDSALVQTATA